MEQLEKIAKNIILGTKTGLIWLDMRQVRYYLDRMILVIGILG